MAIYNFGGAEKPRLLECHNCGANQTVTATINSNTYTATSDADGIAVIKIGPSGTYTVSTPYQSQSKTVEVPAPIGTTEVRFKYYLYLNGTFLNGYSVVRDDNILLHGWGGYGTYTNANNKITLYASYCYDPPHAGRYARAIFMYGTIDVTGFTKIGARMSATNTGDRSGCGVYASSSRIPNFTETTPPTPVVGQRFLNGTNSIALADYTGDLNLTGTAYIYLGAFHGYLNGENYTYIYELWLE